MSIVTFLQGLVFKWGSLVGIRQPDSGANGSSHFAVSDTAFVPNEFTGTITNDWATVPYCATDFAPYDNTATDHLSRAHTPANIARGVGDICRHLGVVEGTRWRMPTQSEWIELYGSNQPNGGEATIPPGNGGWAEGSFTPLSGYAFGAHQSNVRIVSDAEVANADPYINGAVFFPTSGLRDWDYGRIQWIGHSGCCWSSTAQSAVNGYDMWFNSTTVVPQESWSRTYGFSVRCIRE